MPTSNMVEKGIMVAVGVSIVGLLIAFMLPTAMGAYYDDSTTAINQTEGTSYEVVNNLNTTATDINQSDTSATIQLEDNGTTTSGTINSVGGNTTLTINGEDVEVTLDTIHDDNNATLTYSYPNTYGWSDGSSTIFTLIPLMLLLAAVLFIVAYGLSAYKAG